MPQFSIDDFRSRLNDRSLGTMPTDTISLYAAEHIRHTLDWTAMAELADESRQFLPQVQSEVGHLKSALTSQRERMHKRALLFGIATPRRDEMLSISWALAAEPVWADLSPRDLSRMPHRSLITGNTIRMGFFTAMEKTISHIKTLPCVDCGDVSMLESIPGISCKVARMIHAVTAPEARVWTVDVWHMRQLLWAAGIEWRTEVGCSQPAYHIMESLWLEYCDRFFPGIDVWAVQWATWCAAEGEFLSHGALWNDLAEVG